MGKAKILTLKYFKPIDIIGFLAFSAMVFLYFYFGQQYNFRIILAYYSFAMAVALLGILIFSSFRWLYLSLYKKTTLYSWQSGFKEISERLLKYVVKTFPFFIFLFIYDSLNNITYLINPYYFDDILIKIDQFLLRGHDIIVVLYNLIPQSWQPYLGLAYSSYFIFFIITPLVFIVLHKDKETDDMLLSAIIASYLGIIGYMAVPCYGPVIAQRNLFNFDFFPGQLIEAYSKYRDFYHCFPSLHVAISAVWLYYCGRYVKPLFFIYLPIILALWVSTMYLRWHYLVDVLAGFVIAGIAVYLGPKINQYWHNLRKKSNVVM